MERDESKPNIEKIKVSKDVYGLVETLKYNKDWRIREKAAKALGNIKDKRAVEPLMHALRDKSWEVRRRSAEALGNIKDKRTVEPLIRLLKDKNWRIRERVAWALGEIGDERAVEHLIRMLKDENSEVRGSVAYALGVLGNIKSVVHLKLALKDEDGGVRRRVEWALSQMMYEKEVDKEIEPPICTKYTKRIRRKESQLPEMFPYKSSDCPHEYVTIGVLYDYRDIRCVRRKCKKCGHIISETTK